jgi:hypothetical protein
VIFRDSHDGRRAAGLSLEVRYQFEWGKKAVIRVNDDVEEFRELVYVFTSASCREHVMGEMMYVLPLPAIGIKESLNPPPRDFDRVRISPMPLIYESDRIVDSGGVYCRGLPDPGTSPSSH